MRGEINDVFGRIYQQAVQMGEAVNVEPAKPRTTTGRQQHRANAPALSFEEHYKINTAIPFLDHIVTQLDDRFTGTLLVFRL